MTEATSSHPIVWLHHAGQHLGLVPTMLIGAAGSLLATAPVLFSPLRTMRTLPDEVLPDEAFPVGVAEDDLLENDAPEEGAAGGRG